MTELRLHQELYGRSPVDEAVRTYERFGTLALAESEGYWVVSITCKTPAREQQVKNELANFALGLTVKELETP